MEVGPRFTSTGGALFGGDALILPETDGYGGVDYRVGRATWSFDLRFADFDRRRRPIGGGGLALRAAARTDAWVKYYRFATDYEVDPSDVVQSWVLGISGRPDPRWLARRRIHARSGSARDADHRPHRRLRREHLLGVRRLPPDADVLGSRPATTIRIGPRAFGCTGRGSCGSSVL